MRHGRGAAMLIAGPLMLAGCTATSLSGDAGAMDGGPIANDCAELTAMCSITGICPMQCGFAGPCCAAGRQAYCERGLVGFIFGDTGICAVDASADAGPMDAGPVAHDCADVVALCASGSSGCESFGGIACDFSGVCCIHGWEQGVCVGGRLSFTGGDIGICVDASLDAGAGDTR